MNLDSRLKVAAATASVAGLLITFTLGGAASNAGAQKLPNCTVVQNIEGIIDDSGSMAGNDPDNYRADLLEALAFFNPDKTMGATIFASDAAPLFGPFQAGPNFAAIKSALAGVTASGVVGFGTDYDDGFSVANAHNPGANARIFLSDGEATADPAFWRNPKIPAYVVGFGSADFAILNQIATDTGGPAPYGIENASQLRTVSQIINAAVNCEPAPILSERLFKKAGQTKTIGFKAVGHSAQVLISWPTVGNKFKALFGGKRAKKGSVASIARKKKGRVKVKSTRGESYVALNLSKIKGKVKFRLRAKRLAGPETVTAAIIP